MSVILNILGGNEDTVTAVQSSLNKEIKSIALVDNELIISFNDDTILALWDNGQSCCESRYMTNEDDLADFANAKLLDVNIAPGGSWQAGYGAHEIEFLVIKTDKGDLRMANHNEHNGYYGGFSVSAHN